MVMEMAMHRGRKERSQGRVMAPAGQRGRWRWQERPRGTPTPCHPLTLHIEGDEDLGGADGAAGVADVLARVLLRSAGDDQAAIHHPVLPGQGCPQL